MSAPVSPKRKALLAAAKERILVLDGAWIIVPMAPSRMSTRC